MQQFLIQNSDVILKLVLAIGLGVLIGAERTFVHKEAGMKTHALVSMGSALFIIISEYITLLYSDVGGFDPTRMASQIIVGIGFLGAGAIMLQDSKVKGLTTAGGLWVTAAIGMAAGFGLFALATISTVLVLFIFVVLNIIEDPLRRFAEKNWDGEQKES